MIIWKLKLRKVFIVPKDKFNKHLQDLYIENYKILLSEFKEDLN